MTPHTSPANIWDTDVRVHNLSNKLMSECDALSSLCEPSPYSAACCYQSKFQPTPVGGETVALFCDPLTGRDSARLEPIGEWTQD